MASTRSKSGSAKSTNTRLKSSSSSNLSSQDANIDMISLSVVKELLKVQESSIKSFLSVYMDNKNQQLDQIIRSVQDIKNSLEFTQGEFEDFKKSSVSVDEESCKKMLDFSAKFQGLSTKIDEVSLNVNEMDNKTDDLENRSRRNNLCLDGVAESDNEAWQNSEDNFEMQNGLIHYDVDRLNCLHFNPFLQENDFFTLSSDLDPDSNMFNNSIYCNHYVKDQFNKFKNQFKI